MDNWNPFKGKRTERRLEPATNLGPKPGDYPVGSPESRAAARAMHERQHRTAKVMIFNMDIPRPPWAHENFQERYKYPLEPGPDGTVLIGVFSDECEELEEWLKRNDK